MIYEVGEIVEQKLPKILKGLTPLSVIKIENNRNSMTENSFIVLHSFGCTLVVEINLFPFPFREST